MNLTMQEIADLREAIDMAQEELCVDQFGATFPEGTAFDSRLTLLSEKLLRYAND